MSYVWGWRELLEDLGGEIWWLYKKVRVQIHLKSEYRLNRLSLTLHFQVQYSWHTSRNPIIPCLRMTRCQTAVTWSNDLGVKSDDSMWKYGSKLAYNQIFSKTEKKYALYKITIMTDKLLSYYQVLSIQIAVLCHATIQWMQILGNSCTKSSQTRSNKWASLYCFTISAHCSPFLQLATLCSQLDY